MVARETNSSIGEVEGWDIDEFLAYRKSVMRILKQRDPEMRNSAPPHR
ncbi:hypothetical protein [Amorphus orientalis]|uniref:Uncharacterized protein n=1 Tax=Amorphus orientalis TaxID=649198 RepID=A0AAE4AR62_9HYPH|nr:hypothetical protein [Amorphus orientalis]MDQ0314861.1 hypothetical protein [Amorphus orientalis]